MTMKSNNNKINLYWATYKIKLTTKVTKKSQKQLSTWQKKRYSQNRFILSNLQKKDSPQKSQKIHKNN